MQWIDYAAFAARHPGVEQTIVMSRHTDCSVLGRECGSTDVVAKRTPKESQRGTRHLAFHRRERDLLPPPRSAESTCGCPLTQLVPIRHNSSVDMVEAALAAVTFKGRGTAPRYWLGRFG